MEDSSSTKINAVLDSERDIALQGPSTIPWITFSGLPGESPGKFIQAVQRIGFSQGKALDDRWLTDFVTTCFDGDALSWYSGLDEETQNSWAKLRVDLLRRYGPSPGRSSSTSMSIANMANKPTTPGSAQVLSSSSPAEDLGTRGWVEVVGAQTVMLGYLSYDKAEGVNITTDKGKALILALPIGKLSAPMHLYMNDLPAGQSFPYLGLAVLPTDKLKSKSAVPAVIEKPYQFQPPGYDRSQPAPSVLIPSSQCKNAPTQYQDDDEYYGAPKRVYLAGWEFSTCNRSRSGGPYRRRSDTESSDQRGIAEVWKYDPITEELTMSLLMDDETECEMGAYVHGGTSNRPHAHRASEMERLASGGCGQGEERVRLVFQPI